MHLLSQTTRQCDNASFPYINCHKRRDSAITRLFHTSIVIKRRVSAITRLFHTSIVTKRRALYTYTARNAAFAYSSCHKKTRLLVLVYSAQRGFCIHQLSQKDAPCTYINGLSENNCDSAHKRYNSCIEAMSCMIVTGTIVKRSVQSDASVFRWSHAVTRPMSSESCQSSRFQ